LIIETTLFLFVFQRHKQTLINEVHRFSYKTHQFVFYGYVRS